MGEADGTYVEGSDRAIQNLEEVIFASCVVY